jgi:hypothetical protein
MKAFPTVVGEPVTGPDGHFLPPVLMDGLVPSESALAAIQSHPRFERALRIFGAGTVTHYKGNRLVHALMSDRARMLTASFVLHFHFESRPGDPLSGLTIARMRRVCSQLKICSPGRVEAMMMLMRFFGHLESAPDLEDRRLRRLTPTEHFLDWNRKRLAYMFEAIAEFMPEGAEAIARSSCPDFIASVTSHIARAHLAGFFYVDHTPDLRLFFERSAGLVVLSSLCMSAPPEAVFPPRAPIRVSLSELSRSFGVSRAHVRRLIQDAAQQGLMERSADGETIRILPRLDAAMRRATAMSFLYHADCVRLALADIAGKSAVA